MNSLNFPGEVDLLDYLLDPRTYDLCAMINVYEGSDIIKMPVKKNIYISLLFI